MSARNRLSNCGNKGGAEGTWCGIKAEKKGTPVCLRKCEAYKDLLHENDWSDNRFCELQQRVRDIEAELTRVLGWTRKG